MMDLLSWIENTALAVWVRESVSLWAYPGMLSFHTFGLGFVVGINAAIDLRVLGVAPNLPLQPMKGFLPAMWIGFWVNALSGFLLLAAYASTTLTNPIFVVKLILVVLALINVRLLAREVFAPDAGEVTRKAKTLAITSLLLWGGAIVTGRFTAYIDLVKGLFNGN